MIDTFLAMDVGFGVEPEIWMFKESNNYITFRISKRFKGERHYKQFEVQHPATNKDYNQDFEVRLNHSIGALQHYITQINNKD